MTKHENIATALAAAQSEMTGAKKSAKNPHLKSTYADLNAVCDAVMPALNSAGIAVIQPVNRHGDELEVITRFIHGPTGETLETAVPLLLAKRDMQGLGSAITYARRYGLMSLSGIAPEDDDGHAAAASGPAPKPRGPAKEAIDIAVSSLGSAQTLDALKAVFVGLPNDVRAVQAVILAKDTRKGELEVETEHDAAVRGEGNE